jgi:hypothetical protein
MARIKNKDLYLNEGDKIYLGTNKESSVGYKNGDLFLDHTISGVDPLYPGHLVTKRYVDAITISGGVNSGVNSLIELIDTPITYSNKSGYLVTVNQAENALEFTSPGLYNMDGGFASSIYGGNVDGGFSSSVYGGISVMEGGHA